MLSVQENEIITRTVPILKSNSTKFSFFFSSMDIKIFTYGGWAWGGQEALSDQKMKKSQEQYPF